MAKMYQGIGAAIGTAFSLVLGQGLILNIYYHKKVGLDMIEFWKNILFMTVPVVITFLIGIALNKLIISNSFIWLFLKIAIYTIIYSIFMWFFAMNKYEKEMIIKPVKTIFNKMENKI